MRARCSSLSIGLHWKRQKQALHPPTPPFLFSNSSNRQCFHTQIPTHLRACFCALSTSVLSLVLLAPTLARLSVRPTAAVRREQHVSWAEAESWDVVLEVRQAVVEARLHSVKRGISHARNSMEEAAAVWMASSV